MESSAIFELFGIQPFLREFLSCCLVFDVVEVHLIQQNSDGDFALYSMEVGDRECEYLTIHLHWSAGSIAVERKVGEESFVEGSLGEPIHVQMEEFLVQFDLVLLVLAL